MKKTFFFTFSFFVLFCILWEMTSLHLAEYRFILPPVSSTWLRIWENSDLFITHSKATLREMAGGFSLAMAAAFPLAWSMYLWKSSRAIMQPFFIILQSIPMFTLAPIMVFWLGWSYMTIVIPTALMIFFPLTMNIYQGLQSTPGSFLEYFKINQASHWQTFSKLQLPWSMPHIFAGLRISAAFAGIGAVAGEWAGAQSGLGVLMLKSRRETDLETTFGALFCLVIISMVAYGVIAYTEYRYKQHKPIKFLSFGVALCLIGIITFFSPSKNTMPAEINVTRLLLDWLPNSNHVPIYAGIEKKIFTRHNIHLQVLQLNDPSDTVPYITSGQTELALFYMPEVVKANLKNAKLEIVGALVNEPLNSFIFRADSGITSPQDLSGKVIGYCVAGSSLYVLERLLKENHIFPKELINVGFDLVALIGTHQVDAIYGAFWNIEGEHLKFLNIPVSHFKVSELGHPPYSELVFVGKGDIKKYDAFKEAMQESIVFCREHPKEAFELYVRCHPEKSVHTVTWEREAWLKTIPLLAPSQHISKQDLDHLEAWFKE